MPLMSLAATAIDQPKPKDKVIETMLRYLDTDAICCREEPGKLADAQAKVTQPFLATMAPSQHVQIANMLHLLICSHVPLFRDQTIVTVGVRPHAGLGK